MRLFFIFLILAFNINLFSQDYEVSDFKVPKVVMPSPNAASFARFTEFPVGYYTGTVNVSIPLYTIKSGELQHPITASYNVTGIKVTQEASWIGLGWNLNAGGVITRVIRDRDDLGEGIGAGRLGTGQLPQTNQYEPYITNSCFLNKPGGENILNFLKNSDQNLGDTEPDSFYFNFGSHSGQFLLPTRDTKNFDLNTYYPIISGESNLDIKLVRDLNSENSFNFEVTDVDGTKYYFGSKERSASTSVINTSSKPKYDVNAYGWQNNIDLIETEEELFETSTWHLDSIVSVFNDRIIFEYGDKSYLASKNNISFIMERRLSKNIPPYVPEDNTGYCKNIYSGSVNESIYLKKVIFENGELIFQTDNREDIEEVSGLIGRDGGNALKLDKIIIRETYGSSKIKEIDFSTSYFNPQDLSQPSAKDPTLFSRLKLDEIVLKDKNSKSVEPYSFTYFEGTLPNKESLSMDHWGYYNGRPNSHLIPRRSYEGLLYNIQNGANRNVSPNDLIKGSLKTVTYPTGGVTSFELAPNLYEISVEQVPSSYFEKTVVSGPNEDFENDQKAFLFYVAKDSLQVTWKVDLGYTGRDCESQPWNFPDSEFVNIFSGVIGNDIIESVLPSLIPNDIPNKETSIDITNLNMLDRIRDTFENEDFIIRRQIPDNEEDFCQQGAMGYEDLVLNRGWYLFYASKADNGPNLYLKGELKYPDAFKNVFTNKYGPGLRINKQVTSGSTKNETTSYYYESKNDRGELIPNARLLSKPLYHFLYDVVRIEPPLDNAFPGRVHFLRSTSLHDLGTTDNKGILGYSKVQVVKNNNDNTNGKSNYHYYNDWVQNIEPKIYAYNIPRNMPSKNGKLKLEIHVNKENTIVNEKKYSYQSFRRGEVYGLRYINRNSLRDRPWFQEYSYLNPDFISCGFDLTSSEPDNFNNLTTDAFYFKRYRLLAQGELPKLITERIYQPENESYITKETRFEYDDNYLLPVTITSSLKSQNSSVQQDVVFNKYPFMYSISDKANPLAKMLNRRNYQVGSIIERQYWKKIKDENFKLIRSKLIQYNEDLLPEKLYSLNTREILEQPSVPSLEMSFPKLFSDNYRYDEELSFSYSDDKNLKKIKILQSSSTTQYIYGYDKAYPIIKVDNLDTDLFSSFSNSNTLPTGYDNLDILLRDLENISDNADKRSLWNQFNENLRTKFPDAMITTYTYDPLVGMTSQTDPKGYTMYYRYDDFNRLEKVVDSNGQLVSEYKYNYKDQ